MSTFTFTLTGPIVPKARARTTRNGTYHPHRYQQWKQEAIAIFSSQWQSTPLSGVSISIQLIGKHSRRGDADNVSGALLDALVQSGVLQDDSLMHVRSLAIDLQWSKAEPTAIIAIALADQNSNAA